MRQRLVLFFAALGHSLRLLFIGPPSTPQGPPPPSHPNCRCIAVPVMKPREDPWTPELCERQAVKSKRVWADPVRRKKIIQSMRAAWRIRNERAQRPEGEVTGRIVTTINHFSDSLLIESGVCNWYEAGRASKTWEGDKRIRVALRILQIMPHYVGRPIYGNKEQESVVLQALSYLADAPEASA